MRELTVLIFILITAISCNKKEEKPIWLNPKSVTAFNDIAFRFKTNTEDMQAFLITSVQPIILKTEYKNGILEVYPLNKGGIIEGKAEICLRNNNSSFFYDVEVKNNKKTILKEDYRSPKTLNPDSSLLQQRIVYHVDEFSNVIPINKESLFFEDNLIVSTKAKTYQTDKNNPLNAYYVQAGFCSKINISHKIILNKDVIEVTAGPLIDNFRNLIADGTLVTFYYKDERTSMVEATTLNGVVKVEIPLSSHIEVYAQINQLKSNLLKIK